MKNTDHNRNFILGNRSVFISSAVAIVTAGVENNAVYRIIR